MTTIPAPPPNDVDPRPVVAAELARLREELRTVTGERDSRIEEVKALRRRLERLSFRGGEF